MNKTLVSWSTGKDSAWTLYVLRQDPQIEVVGLFSVIDRAQERVPMHTTRTTLLARQAAAAALPLHLIELPDPYTDQDWEAVMGDFVRRSAAQGVESMAFGDLFLEDIRAHREEQLVGTGFRPLFPLWGIPTTQLAEEMLSAGLEAYISSVDLKHLPARLAGQPWSKALLQELPEGVDHCGENGEMHTVVVGGPMFKRRIPVRIGAITQQSGFAYADVIPID